MAKTTLTDLQERISRGVGPAAVVGDPAVRQAIDELAQVRKDLAAAEAAIACEGSGTCGSGTAGDGPVFRENQARRDRLAAQNSELTEQVNTLKAAVQAREQSSFASQRGPLEQERDRLATDINRLTEAKRAELKEHDARVDDADGLLARISALGHLTKENESMRTARWALFLFILLIECMPVLVKVLMNLSKPSHYDLLLQAQDEQDLKRERLRWATSMEEAQMQAAVALDAAETTSRAELDAHVQAARIVLEAQMDLVRKTTQQWRKQQMAALVAEGQENVTTRNSARPAPVRTPSGPCAHTHRCSRGEGGRPRVVADANREPSHRRPDVGAVPVDSTSTSCPISRTSST